jgi:hypothetical protein
MVHREENRRQAACIQGQYIPVCTQEYSDALHVSCLPVNEKVQLFHQCLFSTGELFSGR